MVDYLDCLPCDLCITGFDPTNFNIASVAVNEPWGGLKPHVAARVLAKSPPDCVKRRLSVKTNEPCRVMVASSAAARRYMSAWDKCRGEVMALERVRMELASMLMLVWYEQRCS